MNNFGLKFGIISPSVNIINSCRAKGAEFTYCDKGDDLNSGITQAVNNIPQNQSIFIIMPDLPFLTGSSLSNLLEKAHLNEVLIVPSITGENDYSGTSMLFLTSPTLIPFEFGVNSHLNFQKTALKRDLQYELVHSDPYARDLDTLQDLQYLQNRIENINNSEYYSKLLQKIRWPRRIV